MSPMSSLLIDDLLTLYRRGVRPVEVMEALLDRIDRAPEHHVWITRLSREQVLGRAAALESASPQDLPLYGVPFVIKDNIDLAGVPTTAGCPAFAYTPDRSAHVVDRLLNAGAIPLGKTNLDQFATGLVGTRSPYGECRNSFDPAYISGGSSSGSAVAVALGLASFSLGTDTAGSGRVPAAFNNLVGMKPSCGRLSTRGVVPACRSLDCVSIFALTCRDADTVLGVAEGFDAGDPYSRQMEERLRCFPRSFSFGVPHATQLEFFGDTDYATLFESACERLESLGGRPVEIDFAPFLATARLLYEGPWVAERYAAIEGFIERHPEALHPVTLQITRGGRDRTAVEAFRAQYRLRELQRETQSCWSEVDCILTPTAGTLYSIEAVQGDPVKLNSNLGYYTNFMNLLDLAAIAVPAGWRQDGLPFGVTLVAPAGADRALLDLAARFHHCSGMTMGATGVELPAQSAVNCTVGDDVVEVVVCGAHMEGLPLNHQLVDRGGRLMRRARTSDRYRLYALPGGPPHRPGLVRVNTDGAGIEVELWSLPSAQLASFVRSIPAPLGIGRVELEDGTTALGFLCESYVTESARDITLHGGWRGWLANGKPHS